jgi:hypothetical protein
MAITWKRLAYADEAGGVVPYVSASPPADPTDGMLWWDTDDTSGPAPTEWSALITQTIADANTTQTPSADAVYHGIAAKKDGLTWSLVTGATNAVVNNGYLCNTTGGAFALTLPGAPSVGDTVGVADGASTFHTNNLTIGRNALNIMGLAEDLVVNVKDASFSLVYASAALGWRIAT